MSLLFTPYSTAVPFMRGTAAWVPEEDQERLRSYQTYEEIYWNHPSAFELKHRGGNESRIYIPNARTVVDTTAHFLLKGLHIGPLDPEVNAEFTAALNAFLARERFMSKFSIAKHSGVVRGDWVLHLTANPDKPEGRRLSIDSVDPAAYFPVYADDNLDSIEKVHLAEQFQDGDEWKVKKLTYWYEGEAGVRTVMREEAIYTLDEWAEPGAKPEQVIYPAEALPPEIMAIPVYHFENQGWQGQPFGSSELRGFEALLAAVNQSISDEDLALALEGLGVYATDADSPVDEDGNEVDWEISPARVIEHGTGKKFYRVEGVGSVQPMLEHIRYMEEKLFEASGTSEVARGAVDVTSAESGVALAIKFIPTLAKIENRDLMGLDVLRQLFYDWKAWHKAYEGPDFRELEIVPAIGAKLPVNRKAIVDELNKMLDRQVISRAFYRAEMAKLFDYEFPEEMQAEIIAEQQQLTEAMDMLGARMTNGLEGGEGE